MSDIKMNIAIKVFIFLMWPLIVAFIAAIFLAFSIALVFMWPLIPFGEIKWVDGKVKYRLPFAGGDK